MSWAVPKGPTLDSTIRRMAVHVEDHPIEYFDFEGVIPAKQYGSGDVIVWDWGTWEPEAPTLDPRKAVADGELKFRLHGEKVKGRFTIVRTSRRPGRRRRAPPSRTTRASSGCSSTRRTRPRSPAGTPRTTRRASRPAGPTTRSRPTATPSGTARRRPRPPRSTWPAPRPRRSPPASTRCSRPSPRSRSTTRTGCSRSSGTAIASRPSSPTARSASGPGTSTTPRRTSRACSARRRWIDAREAIVDGEVVAVDDDGRPDFSLLQTRLGEKGAKGLVYQAFDLLYLDGRSLLNVPLEDRKRLLKSVLRDHPRVRFAAHVEGEGKAFFAAAQASRLEGIIAKLRRSPLRAGPAQQRMAEAQDPARAGARGRRLDAGRGQRARPRGAGGRRLRGRQAAVRRQGRGRGSPARSARTCWRGSSRWRSTSRRSTPRRRRTIAAAGAATSATSPGSGRSS